jgi:hypothetical protein
MSITLNSQIHGSIYSYARQQQTMPVVVLCFATKYKASIYAHIAQLLGVFKNTLTPYGSHYPSKH